MTEPFKPLFGISRRQQMVDHFMERGYGETVSYETLELLLNAERGVVQQAVNAAKAELEREYDKVVEPIPGKGYRVVEPREQFGVAQKRNRQARKKRRQAYSALKHVDESRLSPADKAKFEAGRSTIEALLVMEKKHDLRAAGKKAVDEFLDRRVTGSG